VSRHSVRAGASFCRVSIAVAIAILGGGLNLARAEIAASADFEGASAKILAIDQGKKIVRIMPGGDPERGWPCWWYFRVDGLRVGDKLTLELFPSDAKMPREGPNRGKPLAGYWSVPLRATYSADCKTWRQTDAGRLDRGKAIYLVPAEAETVWLAWGPPFTPHDAHALVKEIDERGKWAEAFELVKSRDGRSCPAVRLTEGDLASDKRMAIWLQARQHAWETGSSWVLRGLADWASSDDLRARSLREKSELYIVPIMDIDNTATGNGGKEAVPHGPNRDWTDKPHYPEVVAAQRHLKRLAEERRLTLFIDFHNPSPFERQPYFFVCPDRDLQEIGRRNLERFLTVCRTEMTAPLELAERPRVSDATYDPLYKQMSKNWVAAIAPPPAVSVTLETPWNTRFSTPEGYQSVGAKLGLAIERYLREDPWK
jgi:hypothetical protein